MCVHVCCADSFLIVCEPVLPASSLLAIIAESLIPGHPRKRLDIVRSISLMVVLKVVPSRIGIVPFKLHKHQVMKLVYSYSVCLNYPPL